MNLQVISNLLIVRIYNVFKLSKSWPQVGSYANNFGIMKKLESFIVIICSLLLLNLCSCTQQKTVFKETFGYDTLVIPIDFPYLSFYHNAALYEDGNSLYWGGYNHLMHSVDIFNLTERRVVESIELAPEGPNAILKNQVNSFLFNDSLLFFRGYEGEIKIMNRKDRNICGKVVPFTPEENYRLTYRGVLPGQFRSGSDMRLCGNMIVTNVYPKVEPTMEDVLATSIHFSTGNVEHLAISYPEEMEGDLFKYGSMTYPYLTMASDRVVYNFPYSSRVYVYNTDSGLTETLYLDSSRTGNQSEQKPEISVRNVEGNFEYESMSLRFCETYYDEKTDAYVRVHYKEKDGILDKDVSYLMVYKGDAEETFEYPVPSAFSTRYYVHEGHVYFLMNNSNDYELYFAVIDIDSLY